MDKLKDFVEAAIAFLGILSLVGSCAFWLAALQIRKDLEALDHKNARLAQRQHDNLLLRLGEVDQRTSAIEGFLKARLEFVKRDGLPDYAIPSTEDDFSKQQP